MYGNPSMGGTILGTGGIGFTPSTPNETVSVAGLVADANTLSTNIEEMVRGLGTRLGLQVPPTGNQSATAPVGPPSVYEQLDDALNTLRRVAGIVESIQGRVG